MIGTLGTAVHHWRSLEGCGEVLVLQATLIMFGHSTGHEEDVQGLHQVSRVEAETPAALQAMAAPGAEPIAQLGIVRAISATRGLPGEY